ncbi:MAG TPA: S8 family serine peptidase [Candidatus Limnocylindrales bacterium]|nr:S8 family serine peptidase [Candidatus Limnocylindrales bacterium]
MPRVASAALVALLIAVIASPIASVRPADAVATPPPALGPSEGVVEPSAKADPTGRYIVVYRDGADRKAANARAKGRGITLDRTYKAALKGYAAKLTKRQLAQVKADPDVAFVAKDGIIRAQGQVIPKGIRRVDGPRNVTARINGADERVDADVAVFDTGIDRSHPDLNVVGGYNCSSSNTAAWGDGNGHGTHVAGTVGAVDNGTGVVGVAPGVRLWAVRILDSSGAGLVSWYVCGMDWLAAQRDAADPTRPKIEAVNMSVAKSGSDDRDCGNTNKDAIHKAICRLVAAGVTVIAAAGNNSFNASRLIPASYNEVITVSALADTDGRPGGTGGNGCFSWGTYDTDDTFANFSNYGADVDLIAPGKCIWSTLPGSRYGYSSGTSMAAPHVAGAAALWLASRPGATPRAAKAALQAATNLDYRTSTDPDGNPDRLLDVARLVPAGDFAVETARPTGTFSGAGGTKIVSVKVIRAEDFTGDVTLTAVPGAPLTASFADDVNTSGEGATTVSVGIPPKTPSGAYKVTIRAGDGERTRTASFTIAVDSAGPVAVAPTLAPRTGTTFETTRYAARGRWAAATDNANGVTAYQASWRVDGGAWSAAVLLDSDRRWIDRTLSVGRTYELRVRARDGLGNWGSWAAAPAFTTRVSQDTSTYLTASGTWRTSLRDSWSKGSARYSGTKGAAITRTFTGRAVAWVAGQGSTRGQARVWIDGVDAGVVDLHASTTSYRDVVFTRSWAKSGSHTITIKVLGTTGHPRVDLDALIIVR